MSGGDDALSPALRLRHEFDQGFAQPARTASALMQVVGEAVGVPGLGNALTSPLASTASGRGVGSDAGVTWADGCEAAGVPGAAAAGVSKAAKATTTRTMDRSARIARERAIVRQVRS